MGIEGRGGNLSAGSKSDLFQKGNFDLFPQRGEGPITLIGNLGKLDTQKKNVFIEGEVVISTSDGYELKAPSLQYEDDKREVSTEGVFSFKGPHIYLDGQGVAMNLDSQKVWVKKKARMTFYQEFFKS